MVLTLRLTSPISRRRCVRTEAEHMQKFLSISTAFGMNIYILYICSYRRPLKYSKTSAKLKCCLVAAESLAGRNDLSLCIHKMPPSEGSTKFACSEFAGDGFVEGAMFSMVHSAPFS